MEPKAAPGYRSPRLFRRLHAVGHFGQFSEIVIYTRRIKPSMRQYKYHCPVPNFG